MKNLKKIHLFFRSNIPSKSYFSTRQLSYLAFISLLSIKGGLTKTLDYLGVDSVEPYLSIIWLLLAIFSGWTILFLFNIVFSSVKFLCIRLNTFLSSKNIGFNEILRINNNKPKSHSDSFFVRLAEKPPKTKFNAPKDALIDE